MEGYVEKGTRVTMTCCGRSYLAQFGFYPRRGESRRGLDGSVTISGAPCLACRLAPVFAELETHGIHRVTR